MTGAGKQWSPDAASLAVLAAPTRRSAKHAASYDRPDISPKVSQLMSNHGEAPIYLTLGDAAGRMSVSVKTIRRWIAAGDLPAYRCGERAIRIKLEDLEATPQRIPSALP
jgi:excisionase family DNA binding protein